eukprot:338561-Pyramimonas_sp.AAC.1
MAMPGGEGVAVVVIQAQVRGWLGRRAYAKRRVALRALLANTPEHDRFLAERPKYVTVWFMSDYVRL